MTDQTRVDTTSRVSCPAGEIVGLVTAQGREFRGIPYAEPPVGVARFRAPRRRAPFDEPFLADSWGATPQRMALFDETFIPEPSFPGDDILNLNVFTPAEAREGDARPVLVWIHGGGYRAGSTSGEWYRGEAVAASGAIMVVPSYRLAFDGFGWTGEAEHDNRGIRDLIMALEWVRDNIAAFGGDPAQVTISGQSAGGGAVMALLAAPAASGLFARAWAMSGVLVGQTVPEAERAARAFAARLGVEPTVEGFASVDDLTMQRTLGMVDPDGHVLARGPVPGALDVGPVIGTATLPGDLVRGLHETGGDVPFVVGATSDEFIEPVGTAPLSEELWREIAASWGPAGERYGQSVPASDRTPGRIETDALFRSGVAAASASRREAAAPSWVYELRWVPAALGRASHCIDVPLFLGIADSESARGKVDDAGPLGAVMHREFLAFLHDGDPGWAPLTRDTIPTRVYAVPDGMVDDPFGPLREFGALWSREDVRGGTR